MKKNTLIKIGIGIALTFIAGIGVNTYVKSVTEGEFSLGAYGNSKEERIIEAIDNAETEEEEKKQYHKLIDVYVKEKLINKEEAKIAKEYIDAKTPEEQNEAYEKLKTTSLAPKEDSYQELGYSSQEELELWRNVYAARSIAERKKAHNDLLDFYLKTKVVTEEEFTIYKNFINATNAEDKKKAYRVIIERADNGSMTEREVEGMKEEAAMMEKFFDVEFTLDPNTNYVMALDDFLNTLDEVKEEKRQYDEFYNEYAVKKEK